MKLSEADLAALRPMVNSLDCQRRVSAWLDNVIDWSVASGLTPLWFGHLKLQPLDLFRSALHQSGGVALADLAWVERVAEVARGEKVVLTGGDAHRLVDIAAAAGLAQISATRPFTSAPYRGAAYWARQELRRVVARPLGDVADCDVLFVPRVSGHLADLLPVGSELERRGCRVVFVSDEFGARISKAGFRVVSREAAARREVVALAIDIRKYARQVTAAWASSEVSEHRVLAALVRRQLTISALSIAWSVLGFERLLELFSPRVVVVGNPYTLEGRAAAEAAHRRGVASVALEHGTIFANDPPWERFAVSMMLARGDPGRRALLANGLTEDRVRVAGAPRLDKLIQESQRERAASVLVASSGAGDQVGFAEHERFIETVFAAAELTPKVDWVVKLHPKDRAELYAPAAQRHPAARVTIRAAEAARDGLEIYDYLARSRVMVTVVSSTALDAMVLGVPVISVMVDCAAELDRVKRVDFLARGAVERARSATELARLVRLRIAEGPDPAVHHIAQVHADEQFPYRGQSSSRVADIVLELAGRAARSRS